MNLKRLFQFAITMFVIDAYGIAAHAASAVEPDVPLPTPTCNQAPGTTCKDPWTKRVTIGPGIPAVSVRFDGKLGWLDKIAPAELGFNFAQRTVYGAGSAGATRLVLWRTAFGITAGKIPDQSGVAFGIYIMPYGIQIDHFAAGIALGYSTIDELEFKKANFDVLIPFSYTVQF